ncbi:MAG: hypothetical protein HY518_05765 [Candidatus Aenigmarchaeota archaeon]|nr:hypothetical protein [Candidatus Aenigmarchaeota archaeon]
MALPQYAIEVRRALASAGVSLTDAAEGAKVGRHFLQALYTGTVKNLDRTLLGERKRVYSYFKERHGLEISSLYSPYFEPISERDAPRVQLWKVYVDRYDGSLDKLSRKSGVSTNSISDFLHGKTTMFRSHVEQRIYKATGLQCFNPEGAYGNVDSGRDASRKPADPRASADMMRSGLRRYINDRHSGIAARFARSVGIGRSTVTDFLNGRSSTFKGYVMRKIHAATGLDVFNPDAYYHEAGAAVMEEGIIGKPAASGTGAGPAAFSADDLAEHAGDLFYSMSRALEMIRNNPEARSRFREMVPGGDVGKVTAYIKNMYTDKDDILLDSKLTPLPKRGGR